MFQQNDAADSCILGGKLNGCGFYRCLQGPGKSCLPPGNEAQLKGNECGSSLVCGELHQIRISHSNRHISGCDKKCFGCIIVEGKKICHKPPFCMSRNPRKRSQVMESFPLVQLDSQEKFFRYPVDDSMAV
jgi:hypothetical protein